MISQHLQIYNFLQIVYFPVSKTKIDFQEQSIFPFIFLKYITNHLQFPLFHLQFHLDLHLHHLIKLSYLQILPNYHQYHYNNHLHHPHHLNPPQHLIEFQLQLSIHIICNNNVEMINELENIG